MATLAAWKVPRSFWLTGNSWAYGGVAEGYPVLECFTGAGERTTGSPCADGRRDRQIPHGTSTTRKPGGGWPLRGGGVYRVEVLPVAPTGEVIPL